MSVYCPIGSLCGLVIMSLGCGGPQPSAPVPKNGPRTDRVVYSHPPRPQATVITIGEVPLNEVDVISIPQPAIPKVKPGDWLAVEGVAVHPDLRMKAGAVLIELDSPVENASKTAKLRNEASTIAKGNGGKLAFRAEIRVPDDGPREYRLRLIFIGMAPGADANADPLEWKVKMAEGALSVPSSK